MKSHLIAVVSQIAEVGLFLLAGGALAVGALAVR